jgi:hypothetical protein
MRGFVADPIRADPESLDVLVKEMLRSIDSIIKRKG